MGIDKEIKQFEKNNSLYVQSGNCDSKLEAGCQP